MEDTLPHVAKSFLNFLPNHGPQDSSNSFFFRGISHFGWIVKGEEK